MLTFDLLYQTIGAAYLAVLAYPNLPPDPALIAQLEQARPAVSGENGYAALFDLPVNAGKDWPKDLPECRRETADCLTLAREHLAAWQNTNTATTGHPSVRWYWKTPCTPTASLPVNATRHSMEPVAMPNSACASSKATG